MENHGSAGVRVEEIVRLRAKMAWPENRTSARSHVLEIIERRVFALENGIDFSNPFSEIDEALFACARSHTASDDSGFVVTR